MKTKHVLKFAKIFIPAMVTLIVGLWGGEKIGKTNIINIITNQTGNTINLEGSSDEIAKAISEQLTQNQEEYQQIETKNTELQSQLDAANSKISQLETENNSKLSELAKNNETLATQIKNQQSEMEAQSEQAESEISRLEEEKEDLVAQINSMPNLAFTNSQIYLDGGVLSGVNNPILLVDNTPYYSESALKLILSHYEKPYEYTGEEVNIGKKIETEKLPLSQAEIYEVGYNGVSQNSGIRVDKNGNEFSGILIERSWSNGGYISYFVNEKYNKISGIIHVTKETENDNSATIQIIAYDEKGNEVTAYTSDEMTNLSKAIPFEVSINNNTKVIEIRQDAYWYNRPIEAVISEAYFYNE